MYDGLLIMHEQSYCSSHDIAMIRPVPDVERHLVPATIQLPLTKKVYSNLLEATKACMHAWTTISSAVLEYCCFTMNSSRDSYFPLVQCYSASVEQVHYISKVKLIDITTAGKNNSTTNSAQFVWCIGGKWQHAAQRHPPYHYCCRQDSNITNRSVSYV